MNQAESTELFLAGGGEMGQLIRTMDWAQTPLGPVHTWPQSLRTSVGLCLSSTFPILIAWGPETIQIYNDSYRPICGAKHPESMGQNFRICWETALPVVGDAFTRGQQGEGTYIQDQRMFLDRYGYLEEAFMTFSFAPIRDETGEVGGIFHPITETTDKMLSARRTQVLRDVAAQTAQAKTNQDIYDRLQAIQPGIALDLPFLLFYEISPDGQQAKLVSSSGLWADRTLPANLLELRIDSTDWLSDITQPRVVENLTGQIGPLPSGPYPELPHTALLLPIVIPAQSQPAGFLLAGVSSRRALDAEYRTFYDLMANTISTAFSNVYAYQQEQQRAEALAAIDRTKTAFFSNVSHEFRTPLTLMLGPLEELLQSTEFQTSPYQSSVGAAYRNAQRLLKLVNNLLDFSRIEAGRINAYFRPVDLGALTTDLASSFRSLVERAGLELVVECDNVQTAVYVDADKWEKIVLNLLSNAFKFTLQGRIRIELSVEGEEVVLRVSDTGIGIPARELPRMFERFHRVENAGGRTFEGSGIGLSLVQELVQLHSGTIAVSSEEGKGSVFTVTIPLGKKHLPASQVSDEEGTNQRSHLADSFLEEANSLLAETKPVSLLESTDKQVVSGSEGSILVVDDNADMRAYLTRILSPYFDVQTAIHGLDALDQLRALTPQLILSDVMMPVMDGKQLLRQLRQDVTTASIPLIFLSARAGQEARIDGLEAGADDYLVKPFSALELLTKVRTQISLEASRRQATQALADSEARYRQLSKELDEQVQQRTAELQALVIDLQRSNDNLQQFAYIASHDLQEPLRKIQSFSGILQQQFGPELGETGQDMLLRMASAGERMSTLIRDLLTYSRISTRQQVFGPVSLESIVSKVLSTLDWTISQRNAQIEVGHLPVVKGDETQLGQLVQNLLSNALKFTPENQTPRISIQSTERNAADLPPGIRPTSTATRFFEISVSDQGIGFNIKYLDRIFQVFQRLHGKSEYPGTGVGLAICQRVVGNHGGAITATSELGKGATFFVYLPQ
ncbi:ATP-binding response regulator [Larkinella rosea]|uniref:histidine kinase n=1 Tax=Larkinella rosea TaxID=2025312 RepID=A0A3P1BUH8_9BACT|nr:ATP-binding protein [Larkinella rosea]RRB04204.1 response regulator [Larkinella rosea]